jgi:dCTP deaminase
MSALSKSSIIARLQTGDLVVSPILSPKQLGASSVDLRMGTVALTARAGAQSHVDPIGYLIEPGTHELTERRQQKHERFDIPFGGSFLLHPGSLVLVPTLEWIVLPVDLQGVVTARSSWAREGLNIATATIINPGYKGIVTLELANFGEIPITLHPGLRLAQLALYTLQAVDREADKQSLDGQFVMSFEPSAGNIAKDDEVFVRAAYRATKPTSGA